jgi:butyrate kinase
MIAYLRDVSPGRWGVAHPWNLAAALCAELSRGTRAKAFIVDPTLDEEMIPSARLMGVPGYERHGFSNMLNLRATAEIVAKQMDIPVEKLNLIGAHLGAGVSIVAFEKGRAVDMNQTLLGEGPMGSRRAGTLSHACLLDLAFSGKYTKEELSKQLIDSAGIFGHLGLEKSDEVEREIKFGNEKAALVLQAFAYQVAKEICALTAALRGKVDGIFLTGGLANSKMSVSWIRSRIAFLGPVFVYPGDIELEYLAGRARSALTDETLIK